MDAGMNRLGMVVLAIFLLAVPATAQEGFDVSITGEDTVVDPSKGQTAKFHVDVTNTGGEERRFRVSYVTGTATDPAWYYVESPFLTLAPGENGTSTIYATPDITAQAGTKGPNVIVYPLGDSSNQYTKLVSFSVTRDREIQITEFTGPDAAYDPGEELTVSLTVKNVVQRDLPSNQYRLILDINGEQVTRGIPAIDAGEEEKIEASVDLSGYEAGIYDMTASVKEINGDVHSTQEAKVEVREKRSISQQRDQENRFLTARHSVTVSNDGNTVVEDMNVTESVSWYLTPFVSYSQEPDHVVRMDGRESIVWTVQELEPGEEAAYSYTLNYWSLALIVLILIGAAVMVLQRYRTVTLVKSGKRSGDHHSIHLRVKNKTGSEITGVEVEDFVPGIASLIEKFDSRSPEKIQGTDEGTKLVWKLGRMDPGEERIITYKIKPRVQVEGYISLPEAVVTYEKGGTEREEESHPISADFS